MSENQKHDDDDIEVMEFGEEGHSVWATQCDCVICYALCNCGSCPLQSGASGHNWNGNAGTNGLADYQT